MKFTEWTGHGRRKGMLTLALKETRSENPPMRKRMLVTASVAAALLVLAVGVVVGAVVHVTDGQANLHQDLLRELLATTDTITTGLTISELASHEQRIRTTLELAGRTLNDEQERRVEKAIEGIAATRLAWNEALDYCHGGDKYVKFFSGCESPALTRAFAVLGKPDPYVRQQMSNRGMTLRENVVSPLLARCSFLTRLAASAIQ
jgi:hypothetical protein